MPRPARPTKDGEKLSDHQRRKKLQELYDAFPTLSPKEVREMYEIPDRDYPKKIKKVEDL